MRSFFHFFLKEFSQVYVVAAFNQVQILNNWLFYILRQLDPFHMFFIQIFQFTRKSSANNYNKYGNVLLYVGLSWEKKL